MIHKLPSSSTLNTSQNPLLDTEQPSSFSHYPKMMDNDHSSEQEAILFHSYYLSGYSSSRGSNNAFPKSNDVGQTKVMIVHDNVEDEEEWHYGNKGWGWGRYLSFGRSSSCLWFCMQISWRLLVSLGAALFVFYIATKPPPPIVSIKIAGIRPFGLGEGVDLSGVTTKILSCNCKMELLIENKSKLFGLHIAPPLMDMSFGHLPLAVSHGREVYAENDESRLMKVSVATVKKPMYGAGRSMQDMLESGNGLPLTVGVSLKSHFRVVWKVIEPEFHHQAHCVVLVHSAYDKNNRTQTYSSTCTLTSSP